MRFIYLLFALPSLVFAAMTTQVNPTPIGFWQQVNEHTQHAQSIIEIWQDQDGTLAGKIVGVYPVKGRALETHCRKCTDARKDQPILGMTIIQNLRHKPHSLQWTGGEILDPKVGKTYRCTITLGQDQNSLNVRGYIGISLLGRSQTWHRLTPPALQQELKKVKS